MNISRISLRNFRSWPELDLAVEPGTTLLAGANGAGKSSLVEACLFAMYGATQNAEALIRRGTDEALVTVEISCDAGELQVTRSIRRSGTSAKVSLELRQHVDGRVPSLSAATVTETQQILDDLLGVSRELLLASAFSTQHGGAAFTEAKPADRKRVLSAALPSMEIWPPLFDAAKAELADANSTATLQRARLEQLDGAAMRWREAGVAKGAAMGRRDNAKADEFEAEARANDLAEQAEAAREARRQHAAAVEAQQRAQADHERAKRERDEAERARDRALAAAANAPSVDDARVALSAAMDGLGEAQERHEFIERDARDYLAQLAEARRELASHEAALARHAAEADELEQRKHTAQTEGCPECGKPLDQPEDEAVVQRAIARHSYALTNRDQEQAAVAQWAAREAELVGSAPEPSAIMQAGDALKEARGVAETAQRRLAEAEAIQSLAGSVADAETRAREAAAREGETDATLQEANADLFKWDSFESSAEHDHQAAVAALATARTAHSAAAAELARAEEAAMTAERDATAETEARERLATAERSAAVAGILAAGFGPQGVPALILDSILGDLADEANRILGELSSPIRVDLRSQRVTKDSRLVDALDIIVQMDGMEAPYETLSGGERTRVALSLRAALTRLLAAKKGARVRLLVCDEPSGLDAAGAEAFAQVLHDFTTAGIFDTCIVVTHDERLADRIDRTIRIEKTPSGESRLVEAPAGSPSPQLGDPERLAS